MCAGLYLQNITQLSHTYGRLRMQTVSLRIRRELSPEALPEDAFLQCTPLPAFHRMESAGVLRKFIRTVDAAARDCSGDPPISSTVADAAIADAIPTSA